MGEKDFFPHSPNFIWTFFSYDFNKITQKVRTASSSHRTGYMGLELQPLLKQSFFGTHLLSTERCYLWSISLDFRERSKKRYVDWVPALQITLTGTIISKDSSSAGRVSDSQRPEKKILPEKPRVSLKKLFSERLVPTSQLGKNGYQLKKSRAPAFAMGRGKEQRKKGQSYSFMPFFYEHVNSNKSV